MTMPALALKLLDRIEEGALSMLPADLDHALAELQHGLATITIIGASIPLAAITPAGREHHRTYGASA